MKFMLDSPQGIKQKIVEAGNQICENDLSARKPVKFKKLVWALVYLHAVLQQRFQLTNGWKSHRNFSYSDLVTSIYFTREVIESSAEVPWGAIVEICGEISLGGRVTDQQEMKSLKVLVGKFIRKEILLENFAYSGTHYCLPALGSIR